jgi:arylsulfatase A-like enzyme
VIYPAYAPSDYLTSDELFHMQALYAAEVTLVDRWLGELFAELGALGLWDDTVVILTSDHGILLGEHGMIGKAWSHEGHYECYPMYEELVRIPLIMRVPGVAPRRASQLAQPADLMPSIIEWAGASAPGSMHGVSLVPAIEDDTGQTPTYQYAVSSRSIKTPLLAEPLIAVTDGEWVLNHGGGHATSTLHNLLADPNQQVDLLDANCAKATELHAALVARLEGVGTAEEYIAPWRIPPCT